MKLSQLAASLATFFYAGVTFAQSKPPVQASEPGLLGLMALGIVVALVATRFKK